MNGYTMPPSSIQFTGPAVRILSSPPYHWISVLQDVSFWPPPYDVRTPSWLTHATAVHLICAGRTGRWKSRTKQAATINTQNETPNSSLTAALSTLDLGQMQPLNIGTANINRSAEMTCALMCVVLLVYRCRGYHKPTFI